MVGHFVLIFRIISPHCPQTTLTTPSHFCTLLYTFAHFCTFSPHNIVQIVCGKAPSSSWCPDPRLAANSTYHIIGCSPHTHLPSSCYHQSIPYHTIPPHHTIKHTHLPSSCYHHTTPYYTTLPTIPYHTIPHSLLYHTAYHTKHILAHVMLNSLHCIITGLTLYFYPIKHSE